MEEFSPLDVFQVLSAVADYRVYTITCPPATFSSSLTKLLHQAIQKDVLNFPHPNPECSEKCTKCLLFAALTAVQAVFGYDSSQLSNIAKQLNLHNSLTAPNERESYSHQKILSHEQIENMNKWYSTVAENLVADDFLILLIEYVKSSCTFTAFLAKKSLLSALKSNVHKVHDFIRLIEQNWLEGINPCSSFVEVVNNLLSYKVPYTSVCSETFACLQSLGYIHNFLSIKTDPKTKTFSNKDGIFDYLCLIHKLMKCGLKLIDCGLSKVSDYSPLCLLLQNSILPYSDTFFSTFHTGRPREHFIYLKYLKCLSSLFDIKFIHPTNLPPHGIVFIGSQVSKALLRCLHSPFLYSQLLDCNFVSSKKLLGDNNDQRPEDPKDGISAITKHLVDSIFRVHAILSIGSEYIEPSVLAELFSLLFKVQELVTKCDKDSEDWLTFLFADQDDKWISSLLCLLVIHRKMQLRLEELKLQTNTATVANYNDFEHMEMEKLLRYICPHRLFLQLAKFIGYDHLVLADFLASPETHFLSYLSQYLHTVRENWTNFYTGLVSLSSVCKIVDTTFLTKVNNPITHNVETGVTSSINNETLQQNSTETSIHPIVHLVEDPRSYHQHSHNLLLEFKSSLSDDKKLDERKINDNEETGERKVIDNEETDFHLKFRDARTKQIVLVSYSDSENEEEETTEKSNLIGGKSCYSDIISATSTEKSIIPANNIKVSRVWVKNEDALCKKNSTGFVEQKSKEENSKGCLEIPEELVLVMEMFIRLRLYLERLVGKNIFPYNVQPLILLLEVCEDTYDNFCTS